MVFIGGHHEPGVKHPSQEALDAIGHVVLHQLSPETPIFQDFPWARVIIPLRVNNMTRGILVLGGKPFDAYFDSQEVAFIEQVAGAAAIAGESVRLFEVLQDVAGDRLRVRSAERMQLAYRLHDEPLQRTYSIVQSLDSISKAVATDLGLAQQLSMQKEEVRVLARELRDICTGLRPPIMSQGLFLTLREVAGTFQAKNPGIALELELACEDEPTISEQAMDSAYHVVTEALNNVSRHSGATYVRVKVSVVSGTVQIAISDNGRGTQLTGRSSLELVRDRHLGIAGMHEWADMAGGRLKMLPAQPSGTLVELHIPINGKHPNEQPK